MHAIVEDLFYDRTRAPVALVFGNNPERRRQLSTLAAARGARVAAEAPLSEAEARLDARAVTQIVLIDAAEAGDPALDPLLDRAVAAGAAYRFETLLVLAEALVDRAGALLGAPGIAIVAEEDLGSAEVADAIDALLAPTPACVAEDSDEEVRRRRLAALGEDAGRIARALTAMASEPGTVDFAAASVDTAAELAFLRAHVRLRRLRERVFEAALFADPAWDILLDLRMAALEGRRVPVSSLCIAAAVPATTALRWIGVMTEKGLLRRVADPDDGRRAFVALDAGADAGMARYAAMALQLARG